MPEKIFELKDVDYSYLGRFPALRGISLDIIAGQKVTIIGANGSGKSTLMQMCDALIFPDKGVIRAFGTALLESSFDDEAFSVNFRKRVGMVFQNSDVQLFCPTVKEDMLFGPLQLGMNKGDITKRLEEFTDLLDIGGLLERSVHQLSIGEKRRVAIASTLMSDPDVIIIDEPTAGLDPMTTRRIIDFLLDASERGKTIITSTHDLHIVEEISDIVHVFSQEKRIVRSAGPDEILADTKLLKANNLLHVHSHRHDGKTHAHPHLHVDHHHEEHGH